MDPLSQIVSLLHPARFVWKPMEARGDWAIRFPANRGVSFGLLTEGSCRVEMPGAPSWQRRPGDFVLLAGPPEWVARGGRPVPAVPFASVFAGSGRRTALGGAAGLVTARLASAHFFPDGPNAGLLLGLLPPVVRIATAAPGHRRLLQLLDLIAGEAASQREGRTLMLQRLVEALLLEVVRHRATGEAAAAVEAAGPGLLAGLADDRLASVLRAVHGDVRRSWSVAGLAAQAALSRSAFAERFTRVVGMAPMAYVLQWRMALAREALRAGQPLAEVARDCGYRSTSAFSTAFARTVGCPPARYAEGPVTARA